MYKLIIIKTKNRLGLMKAICELNLNLPFCEVPKIVDSIKNGPFICKKQYLNPEKIHEMFDKVAEYKYEEYEEYIEHYYKGFPPWEADKYIDAKNWYYTLSKEDKDKIDILVNSIVFWA